MKNQKIKMQIGNELFDLKTGKYDFYRRSNSLLDCYTKPSKIKVEIFNYWIKWFCENFGSDDDFICIRSFNVRMFTLNGFITINNIEYYFLITPTRREIFEK